MPERVSLCATALSPLPIPKVLAAPIHVCDIVYVRVFGSPLGRSLGTFVCRQARGLLLSRSESGSAGLLVVVGPTGESERTPYH